MTRVMFYMCGSCPSPTYAGLSYSREVGIKVLRGGDGQNNSYIFSVAPPGSFLFNYNSVESYPLVEGFKTTESWAI